MASLTTIARPYAKAIYEYARADKCVPAWSDALALLAAVIRNPQVGQLLHDPKRSRAERADILIKIGGKDLPGGGDNMLRLLADNNRLIALPAIAEQFEQLRAIEESTLEGSLTSARDVDQKALESIRRALEKRFGKQVNLQSEVDPKLLGGAVIRVGDLVIDGSLKSRLHKLSSALLR